MMIGLAVILVFTTVSFARSGVNGWAGLILGGGLSFVAALILYFATRGDRHRYRYRRYGNIRWSGAKHWTTDYGARGKSLGGRGASGSW